MSGRRGVLGGLAGLGIFGPKVVEEAVKQTPGRVIQGTLTNSRRFASLDLSRGYASGHADEYTDKMDDALNTPFVKSLLLQNHRLQDFVRALGEAPCVLGHKSNAPWFKRMATMRKVEQHSTMIDDFVKVFVRETAS